MRVPDPETPLIHDEPFRFIAYVRGAKYVAVSSVDGGFAQSAPIVDQLRDTLPGKINLTAVRGNTGARPVDIASEQSMIRGGSQQLVHSGDHSLVTPGIGLCVRIPGDSITQHRSLQHESANRPISRSYAMNQMLRAVRLMSVLG